MLACRNLQYGIGQTKILSDVSFVVEPNDAVCIVGSAGSGKSTILRLLLRADDPSSGTIEVDGVPLNILPPAVLQLYRARLGLILQEPLLLSHLTVEENIAYPLQLKDVSDADITSRVREMLAVSKLATKAKLLPAQLSESERAAACIARAFITSPMIILADEPLAPLDADSVTLFLKLLRDARKRGASVLVFSRDPKTAIQLEARTVKLENGRTVGASLQQKPETPPVAVAESDTHESEPATDAPVEPPAKEDEDAEPVHVKTPPRRGRPRKHKTDDAEHPKAEKQEEKEEHHGKGHKKIRITSIGS